MSFANKSFYEKAIDPEFWLDLNPSMTICKKGKNALPGLKIDKGTLEDVRLDMHEDGYFTTEPLYDPGLMERLSRVVEKLHYEQWPTVFAMVYDEFWEVYQPASTLLNHILGPGYKQLPNYWVYYVVNDNHGSGWAPHRDRAQVRTIRSDGMPNSMTIWIALTDATPLNGCMYVLPAGCDPNYPHDPGNFQVPRLQDIRALPTTAGSILSWNESLIHWGARSSDKGAMPRMSAACAFQRGDVDPLETPVLDPFVLPTFEERLGTIGQQLYRFAVHTGMPESVKQLADHLGQLSETIVIYDYSNPYKRPLTKSSSKKR